jgi:diacylglycerol kinase (ATP)
VRRSLGIAIRALRMNSPHKGKPGIKRIWNALFYALDGFTAAFKHEDSFRLEVMLSLALIPLALSMHIGAISKALLIGSVLLVLITELINSAIEAICDRVSLENHVLAKRAKDFGSAAVMLSLINAAVVWILVLFGGNWMPI